MSRRKQSNPKPIKRQIDGDPDELAKEVNLPINILALKQNDDQSGFSVRTQIPLPKGSSFGPFKIRQIEGEVESEDVMMVPGPDSEEVAILIETETGYWLRLLQIQVEEKSEETNTVISIQGEQICCEVTKDIPEDTELVATVTREEGCSDEECPKGSEVAMESVKEVVPSIPAVEVATPVPHPLIYGCPHCGVRFSSPRTLQGHITYYCSKRPGVPGETSCDDGANRSSPGSRKRVASTESKDGDDSPPVSKRSRQTSSGSSHERLFPTLSPGGTVKQHVLSSPTLPKSDKDRRRTHSGSSVETDASETHTKVYRCPQCAYSTNKKSSLHSHLRNMHTTTKSDASEDKKSEEHVFAPDKYCTKCKIQFSSQKTYQGHKEFYCGKRQKQAIPDGLSDCENGRLGSDSASPIAPLSPAIQPGPVLIPPGYLSASGQPVSPMTMPGSLAAQPTVVFTGPIMTAPGPAGIALTMPTVIMQPLFLPSSLHGNAMLASPVDNTNEEKPLDLTVKKQDSRIKRPNDTETQSSPISREGSPLSEHDVPKDLSVKTKESNDSNQSRTSPSADKPTPASKQAPIPSTVDVPTAGTVKLPHNLNICSECNIVFYKHENFIIHKQFYCSGRKTKPQTTEEQVSAKSTGTSERQVEKPVVVDTEKRKTPERRSPVASASPQQNDHLLQFSCTPCRIKFSSLSTLEAHQRYYCPYRPQNPELGLAGGDAGQSIDSQPSEEDLNSSRPHICLKCRNEYPTARLLKVHLCQNSARPGIWNLLRCNHCSFVTHKESQFSDHVRKHSLVKGFRCSLCGYRGNTIRGMRMHGKMHVDKGESFTDEHMIVLDGDEVNGNGKDDFPNPVFSSDIESEIMRLKNEPYKRRRSRYKKQADDSKNSNSESPKNEPLFVCGMCNAPFVDCNELGRHMQRHLETKSHQCSHCEYSTNSLSHLDKHMKLIHKVEASTGEHDRTSPTHRIKLELTDPAEDGMPTHPEAKPHLCAHCDYATSSLSHLDKHIKFVHKSVASVENGRIPLVQGIKSEPVSTDEDGYGESYTLVKESETKIDKDVVSPKLPVQTLESSPSDLETRPGPSSPSKKKSELVSSLLQKIKREPIQINTSTEKELVTRDEMSLQPVQVALSPATSPDSDRAKDNVHSPTSQNGLKKTNFRYCNHCDISFMYLSSFVAHKKYYCTASITETLKTENELVSEAAK